MKISKTFRLSEEAVDILNKQANQSQFIEDLVLGVELVEPKEGGLTKEEVIQLIKQYTTQPVKDEVTSSEFVPKPPDPEKGYPCCQGKRPCKHWVWDESTGEGYVNTITGEVRAA